MLSTICGHGMAKRVLEDILNAELRRRGIRAIFRYDRCTGQAFRRGDFSNPVLATTRCASCQRQSAANLVSSAISFMPTRGGHGCDRRGALGFDAFTVLPSIIWPHVGEQPDRGIVRLDIILFFA